MLESNNRLTHLRPNTDNICHLLLNFTSKTVRLAHHMLHSHLKKKRYILKIQHDKIFLAIRTQRPKIRLKKFLFLTHKNYSKFINYYL